MASHGTTSRTENPRGTILVTGASGGIGRHLVARLAGEGYAVIACARAAESIAIPNSPPGRVIPLSLDVTDEASIAQAAARVAAEVGPRGLAGLVNMAGIIVEGPLDLISVGDFRTQFEVNVIGVFALTRALLPQLRRARGRIVNIGGAAAHVTGPFFGAISASKAALASINDAMRMEFRPLGIEVVLIEPGAIETGIWARSGALLERSFAAEPADKVAFYKPAIDAMRAAMRKSPADQPRVVVEAIMTALTDRRPRPRRLVGKGTAQIAILRRLPIRMRDRLMMQVLGIAKALKTSATPV